MITRTHHHYTTTARIAFVRLSVCLPPRRPFPSAEHRSSCEKREVRRASSSSSLSLMGGGARRSRGAARHRCGDVCATILDHRARTRAPNQCHLTHSRTCTHAHIAVTHMWHDARERARVRERYPHTHTHTHMHMHVAASRRLSVSRARITRIRAVVLNATVRTRTRVSRRARARDGTGIGRLTKGATYEGRWHRSRESLR